MWRPDCITIHRVSIMSNFHVHQYCCSVFCVNLVGGFSGCEYFMMPLSFAGDGSSDGSARVLADCQLPPPAAETNTSLLIALRLHIQLLFSRIFVLFLLENKTRSNDKNKYVIMSLFLSPPPPRSLTFNPFWLRDIEVYLFGFYRNPDSN